MSLFTLLAQLPISVMISVTCASLQRMKLCYKGHFDLPSLPKNTNKTQPQHQTQISINFIFSFLILC